MPKSRTRSTAIRSTFNQAVRTRQKFRELVDDEPPYIESHTQDSYRDFIDKLNTERKWFPLDGKFLSYYDASDLTVFKDHDNFHPWQKHMYDIIVNENGTFKKPHDRHIHQLKVSLVF